MGTEPEEGGRATGVVGTDVGICESEVRAPPQDEQNRLSAETCAEQEGHLMMRDGVVIAGRLSK